MSSGPHEREKLMYSKVVVHVVFNIPYRFIPDVNVSPVVAHVNQEKQTLCLGLEYIAVSAVTAWCRYSISCGKRVAWQAVVELRVRKAKINVLGPPSVHLKEVYENCASGMAKDQITFKSLLSKKHSVWKEMYVYRNSELRHIRCFQPSSLCYFESSIGVMAPLRGVADLCSLLDPDGDRSCPFAEFLTL